jgi:hypothetical protein
MYSEQTAPAGALSQDFDEDRSLEAEQLDREDAALRSALLRRRQAALEDRRQFSNPINSAMLARIMGAWVATSLSAVE